MGAGRRGRLPAAELVGLPRGDPELRGDRVRPRCADRVRLLALGGRQPAGHGHRAAGRRRRRQRIARRRNDFGQRRAACAASSAPRRRRATASTATSSPCTRSAWRSSTCPRTPRPAYLGFNLFMQRDRHAPSSTAPTSRTLRRPAETAASVSRSEPTASASDDEAAVMQPLRRCRRECAWPTSRRRRRSRCSPAAVRPRR